MTETLVLIGTAKGLFTLRSTDGRQSFELHGPALPGEEVYATCIDRRGSSPHILAGSVSMHWGPVIRRSDDLGETWTEQDSAALAFPADTGAALNRIWQLTPGGADEPDVIYAGVEPAALFRSTDGGASFSLLRGLWDHPHRPEWEPGGGGLCLHTVLVHPEDPARLLIAISAAGVYLSDDGGDTWRASNSGIVVTVPPRFADARVRPVRPQGGPRCRERRAALPAAPRRHLPQRQRRRLVGADAVDRRCRLRLPRRGPPHEAGHRVPDPLGRGRVPLHARTARARSGAPPMPARRGSP